MANKRGRKPYTEKQKEEQSRRMKAKWADKKYRDSQSLSQKNGNTGGWNKGVKMPQISGDKSPHWKGGITPDLIAARNCIEYKAWRNDVFERDMYTCQLCFQTGCYLEAHHIESFSKNKNLRYDVDNGVTLCRSCHALVDSERMRTLSTDIKKTLI